MSRWWRAYDEAVDDPKLILLTDKQHRAWFNLCCITSQNGGVLPPLQVIAVKLRMTVDKAKDMVAQLAALKLIDHDGNGVFAPHNWSGRQFQSDVSTERVKRFRNGKRNVAPTVSETPPDTDSETDNRNRPEATASGARKRATRLTAEWWPSLEDVNYAIAKGLDEKRTSLEAEKFRNYWTAKSGSQAAKLDWHATWQNWIINAAERTGGPQNGQRQQSLGDLAREIAGEVREREFEASSGRPLDHVGRR